MREEEALRYLLRLTRAMTANPDLGTVLGMVIEHSVRLTAGQAGVIALRGGHGRLRARASYGMPHTHQAKARNLKQGATLRRSVPPRCQA